MTKRVFPFAFLLQALLLLRALFISCHREMKMSGVLILHHTIVASITHTVHIWHSSSFICLPQTLSLMFYCAAVVSFNASAAFPLSHTRVLSCLIQSVSAAQAPPLTVIHQQATIPHKHAPLFTSMYGILHPHCLWGWRKAFFNFIDFFFFFNLCCL